MLERTELHSREAHRGVAITIETRTDQEGRKQFAAHVPTPGHGYLGCYFDTPEEALAAARAHVDAGANMHPDGRGRAVASSSTGAQLYTGYRVQHTRSLDAVGVIATITPDGERVAVTWPTGNTTWHQGYNLRRVGTVAENERHPETRAGYPPDPRLAAQQAETDEQRTARLALEQVLIDEQCWVELTRSQVADLLSLVQDRLAQVEGRLRPEQDPPDELYARRSELLVLKGMLLIGRDDPGRVTA